MIETEVKIRIKDIDSAVKRIIQQGARLEKERYLEENTLYDFPSQLLYKKRQALRLRKINKKTFLTFKGAPLKSRKFKIREEYETEVKNEREFKKILKSVGLSPTFQYKKYRRVFRKKRLKICLDETPAGNFLELEGEREDIVKTAKALGFSKKEFIKSDYIQLIKEARNKEHEER
jgi:predicted adenylyl cyclase CyaB